MKLKIGRDCFMDNGACVQLLTQSKEKSTWGSRPSPVLSKRAIREIAKCERIEKPHNYGGDVTIYRLKI